ncbi:MAG: SRPBCC domain-containing protein [Cytophagales bacterium]
MPILFSIKRKIKVPIEVVFDALTNAIVLSEFTGKAVFEPKIGSFYQMFDGWVSGEILAFERNKTLSYTWKTTDWDENVAASIVSYAFKEKGGSTSIELTHSNFPNQKEADEHQKGWEEHVFLPLEKYLIGE